MRLEPYPLGLGSISLFYRHFKVSKLDEVQHRLESDWFVLIPRMASVMSANRQLNMNTQLKFKQTDGSKVHMFSDAHLNHNPRWEKPIWAMRGFKEEAQ